MEVISPVPQLPGLDQPVLWAVVLLVVALLGAGIFLTASGLSWTEFRAGLAVGLRGLLGKELRSRSRGWRPVWVLTGYLAALTLSVAGFLALVVQVGGTIPPTLGMQLYSTLSVGAMVLLAFITPALTAGAISGERERRTLDLLLVTRASALGLAGGKLLGALFYILFLLIASLPAFALVYLFGGMPLRTVGLTLLLATATALAYAALGLLASAVFKRTVLALIVSYLLVLGLVLGLPFLTAATGLAGLAGLVGPGRPVPPPAPPPVSKVSVPAVPPGMARPPPLPPGAVPVPSAPPPVATEPPAPPRQVAVPPHVYLYASPLVSLMSVLPAGPVGTVGPDPVSGLLRGVLGGPSPVQPPDLAGSHQSVYVVGYDPVQGQPETVIAPAPWVYLVLFSGALTLLGLLGAALALAPVSPWRAWRTQRRRRPEGRGLRTEGRREGRVGV